MLIDGYQEYNVWLTDYFQKNQRIKIPKKSVQKRIFLLTDGMVNNPEEVVAQAGICNENIRVHTFGIGDGCDKSMVIGAAHAGRGSCSFVIDKSF